MLVYVHIVVRCYPPICWMSVTFKWTPRFMHPSMNSAPSQGKWIWKALRKRPGPITLPSDSWDSLTGQRPTFQTTPSYLRKQYINWNWGNFSAFLARNDPKVVENEQQTCAKWLATEALSRMSAGSLVLPSRSAASILSPDQHFRARDAKINFWN